MSGGSSSMNAAGCEYCPDLRWTIVREGDVAVSWACDEHLAAECDRIQTGQARLILMRRGGSQ